MSFFGGGEIKRNCKNKRGPTPGKPKPQDAEIVRMVNAGVSQQQIVDLLKMPDADPKRKIRRIIRRIESAAHSRNKRRIYEESINKGRELKGHLLIFSADYQAFLAFPELAGYSPPRLVTSEELFRIFDETYSAAIESLTKKTT